MMDADHKPMPAPARSPWSLGRVPAGRCILHGVLLAAVLLIPAVLRAEKPKRGGTVVYALSSGPRSLDPHQATSTVEIELASQVFETLIALGEDFTPRPSLAASVEATPDATRYTFRLRQGVRFHNGKVLTAADVLASFRRYRENSPNAAALSDVGSFDTPDPATFVINMKNPAPVFLDVLKSPGFPVAIMPADEAAKPGGEATLIGTGPFRMAEWRRDSHILLRRFDDYSVNESATGIDGYAGRKTVYVDEVRYNIMPEANGRMAAIQSGEADIASQIPLSLTARIDGKDGFVVQKIFPGCMQAFFLQAQTPPTDKLLVRQAIQAAMGVDDILEAIGQVTKRNGQLSYPGSPLFTPGDPDFHYDMNDPAKAKSLLQKAGYKGETIVIQVTPAYSWQMNSALVLAEQLKAAGMTVRLQNVDIVTAYANRERGTGNWNIDASLFCSQALLGPAQWRQYLTVYSHFKDPAVDDAYRRTLYSPTLPDRQVAWTEVQRRLFDQAYWMKLADFANINVYRTRLHGVTGWYNLRFWGVWRS